MLVINPMSADARVDKEAASLAAAGADVTVLATSSPQTLASEARGGYTIVRRPYQRVVKDRVTGTIANLGERGTIPGKLLARVAWAFGGAFLKLARSCLLPTEYYRGLAHEAVDIVEVPDIVHAHDLGTLQAAAKLSDEWRQRTGTRPRVVYDSHELYVEQLTRWRWWEKLAWRLHERRWIRRADAVITVSDGIARELQKRYRLTDLPTVILNSPRLEPPDRLGRDVRRDTSLDGKAPLAVYAGAVKPSRGVEVLVDVIDTLPDWHIALVGSTLEQLAAVVNGPLDEHPAAPRIHPLDPVPSWALPEYLSTANVGIHPLPDTCLNHRLALPNKLFDYAFAGIPIVANDLPEMAALIKERHIGVVCDTTSLSATTAALESAVRSERNDATTLADLSWEQQEDTLLRLYDKVL